MLDMLVIRSHLSTKSVFLDGSVSLRIGSTMNISVLLCTVYRQNFCHLGCDLRMTNTVQDSVETFVARFSPCIRQTQLILIRVHVLCVAR